MLFTKDKMAVVLRGLYENINGHDGVKICLKQGSCNFENWIQIELCRHLQNEFSSDFDIKIEEKVGPFVKVVLNQLPLPGASNYIDVLMSPKLNDGSVVIEIKIARLGGG